jgi:hypothetical protein
VRIIACIEDPLAIEEIVAYLDKTGALTEVYGGFNGSSQHFIFN